jgi:hypothetical protein
MVLERSSIQAEENVETSSAGDLEDLKKNRFHELYIEGMKMKMRQQKLSSISIEQDCTFKPNLIAKRMSVNEGKSPKETICNTGVFNSLYERAQYKK